MYYSPLRYPGGKRRLAKFVAEFCKMNGIDGHYVEPYAGGASVGLSLLINGYVSKITINDFDRSIYAFWDAVLNHTERLCKAIEDINVNVDTWHIQRNIQKSKNNADLFDLGFSTFYLNRTNVSGVIKGGIIGGLNQTGKYKIDCRFNKSDLIARIQAIASFKSQIIVTQTDAIDLVERVSRKTRNNNLLFYLDPPYYHKGKSLYHNHYSHSDHVGVADMLRKLTNRHWLLSYDDSDEIRDIYREFTPLQYDLYHSAHISRIGSELIYSNPYSVVPSAVTL